MVLGRIEVGKGDVRPHGHDRQEWVKLEVLLRYDITTRRSGRPARRSVRVEDDDRITHGFAGGINDTHAQAGRVERRRYAGQGQRKQCST